MAAQDRAKLHKRDYQPVKSPKHTQQNIVELGPLITEQASVKLDFKIEITDCLDNTNTNSNSQGS